MQKGYFIILGLKKVGAKEQENTFSRMMCKKSRKNIKIVFCNIKKRI